MKLISAAKNLLAANSESYIKTAFGSLLVILICEWLWPELIPFRFLDVWRAERPWYQGVLAAWPTFAFALTCTSIVAFSTQNPLIVNRYAEEIFTGGFFSSLKAGVFEELAFRWLIFYNVIVGVQITNWLFFKFLFGWGMVEWLFLHFFGPVANFFTMGYLAPYLFSHLGWMVGAAIISCNGKFRDGHAYNGWLGLVISWFMGMYLFYLMFNYGLLAAMVSHFIYDLLIFVVLYIDSSIERTRGFA